MNQIVERIYTFPSTVILDADDHTIALDPISYPEGFFDGWVKVTVVIGALQTLDLSYKVGYYPYKRSCYIDLNVTDNTDPAFVECDGAVVVDETWHHFLLYDPSNPSPIPLTRGTDPFTLYVAYITGAAGATADIELRLRGMEKVR